METDLKRVYRLGTRRHKDNQRFLRRLKYRHPWSKRKLTILQRELTREVWAEVDCTECGNCCSSMQLQLNARDCAQVAEAIGITTEQFRSEYTSKHRDGFWYLKKQPCAFQDARTRLCTIYDQRPSRCHGFPYMDENILDDMAGTLDKVPYCPIVFNVIEELKAHPELQPRRRGKR